MAATAASVEQSFSQMEVITTMLWNRLQSRF